MEHTSTFNVLLLGERARICLASLRACTSPGDPAVLENLSLLIALINQDNKRQKEIAMEWLAADHQDRPSLYTNVLLSSSLSLEEYSKAAMQAFDDPSGILVKYLLANASLAHAPFWTRDNKPLLARLLTHPNKPIRLLGASLASRENIYNPKPPSFAERVKAPLRKILKR